jgi:hypothetical protein
MHFLQFGTLLVVQGLFDADGWIAIIKYHGNGCIVYHGAG